MTVKEQYHTGTCDECDAFTTLYEIELADGYTSMKLCKKCLMELLRSIIER